MEAGDDVIGEIAARTGLPRERAGAAVDAVLETLGRRITAGEAHDLADRLPEALREPLLRGARRFEEARRLSLNEFLALVAGHEHVSLDEAREHTRAVLAQVGELAGGKELSDVAAQLPRDFADVLPTS